MTAFYNEFDPKAAAWLRELIRCGLIADGVVDERSILDVEPADLAGFTQCHFFAGVGGWSLALRLAGWPDSRPVWTGSPPCQPFSAAGRQLGKDDERHLAPHFASLVAACQPVRLFGEQVASAAVFGKASSRSGKSVEGQAPLEWAWLDDLFERLEAAHYACGASDIPAAGVGAAHIRQRTFFGAQRLDDPAGPRHDGPFAGPEGLARNETWLRLSGAGSGHGGLANAADAGFSVGRHGSGRAPRSVEQPERLRADDGVADADDARSQGRVSGRPDQGRADQPGHGGRGGATGGMANADAGGEGVVGNGGIRLGGGGPRDARAGHWRGGSNGGVADAEHAERWPVGQHGEDGRHGPDSGWEEAHGLAGTRGEVCGVADAAGSRHQSCERNGGICGADAGAGTAAEQRGTVRASCSPSTSGPSDFPWRTSDWLFCRDGKWRPVESGTFPLAHGVSARVGRLRGYGNAIVPQAAAEFIKAFDAASAECFRLNDLSTMTTDEGVFG